VDYVVEEVALTPDVEREVLALASVGFQTAYPEGRITTHTTSEGRAPPLCLVARIGKEIIGFNAFIAHTLPFQGGQIEAYQSCWTVTSPAHRGKKIFQNIVSGGREILMARGAAFIFGFPNEVSRPLFVHKLGYREIACCSWSGPGPFGLAARKLDRTAPVSPGRAVSQDNSALIELKRLTHGEQLAVVESDAGMLWGVYRRLARRQLGLRTFDIGGIAAESPGDIAELLRLASAKLKAVASFQLATNEGNRFNGIFPGLQAEQVPLIIDDLNLATGDFHFDFFGGIRDYY
jgi:hypothetical protein